MDISLWLRQTLLGCACGLATALAWADAPCRIAFDMGSSGIRAGASDSKVTAHADINSLAPLWAGRGLEEILAPTIAALRNLPAQAGFAADCETVGGGFSAWRLALQQDAVALTAALKRIQAESGVPVLVMPQEMESAYDHFGARQLLGARLTTSHVLDIGGGSLQIAGARTSFGDNLGQKAWHRELCQSIRGTKITPCGLQPMSESELAAARALLAEKLRSVVVALPQPVSMTAISRPVSRGVLPAVARVAGADTRPPGFRRSALTTAIARIAPLAPDAAATLTGTAPQGAYLLSDMLLVEGLMKATGGTDLHVAEIDLTNLPGLLTDDRAFTWGKHYECYLQRLRDLGLAAYASDPASCADRRDTAPAQ